MIKGIISSRTVKRTKKVRKTIIKNKTKLKLISSLSMIIHSKCHHTTMDQMVAITTTITTSLPKTTTMNMMMNIIIQNKQVLKIGFKTRRMLNTIENIQIKGMEANLVTMDTTMDHRTTISGDLLRHSSKTSIVARAIIKELTRSIPLVMLTIVKTIRLTKLV